MNTIYSPKQPTVNNHSHIQQNIPPATGNKKKKKKNHNGLWLEEAHNTAKGEMALWVAVITQAMMDAQSRCKKAESQYHKHEAIRWLTSGSKDFTDVCLCAGLEPDYVRKKAKQAITSPSLWRAEAGKGSRYEERKKYRERIKKQKQLQKQDESNLTPNLSTNEKLINFPA